MNTRAEADISRQSSESQVFRYRRGAEFSVVARDSFEFHMTNTMALQLTQPVGDSQVVVLGHHGKQFSLIRALVALTAVLVFFVTNPARDLPNEMVKIFKHLGISRPVVSPDSLTDYGLFSLEKGGNGVTIHVLNTSKDICPSSMLVHGLCTVAGKTFENISVVIFYFTCSHFYKATFSFLCA